MDGVKEINDFRFNYRWLSNFHLCPIHYEGRDYPSTEHAYQAAKVADDKREPFTTGTCAEVKKLGSKVTITRRNWDVVKVQVMMDLMRLKFTPGSELGNMLLATGDAVLIEGNWWGDKFWGVCDGEGQNQLGILLMQRREELRRLVSQE